MLRFVLIFSIVLLVAFGSTNQVEAQIGTLKLEPRGDGFTGEYVSQDLKLTLQFQTDVSGSSLSRIVSSDGQTLAESLRSDDVITVNIAGVVVKYFLDSEPRKARTLPLSESDSQKLKSFITSEESAPLRKVLAEFLRQRGRTDARQVRGFLIIAMILGDGPGAPEAVQSKIDCRRPILVPTYASFRPIREIRTSRDDCLGCCGPACWGCTGCYTQACLNHDVCVGAFGATNEGCMVLLALAIASMQSECVIND